MITWWIIILPGPAIIQIHSGINQEKDRIIPEQVHLTGKAIKNMRHFKQNPKKDIDFKTTVFGKVVFYFFHALFIFIGIYILISPISSVLSHGIESDRDTATTIFAVAGASVLGLIMIVMITLSGLSVTIFKKA